MTTPDLETVLRCADADLEGLIEQYAPDTHPAHKTRHEIAALLEAQPWQDLEAEREKVRVLRELLHGIQEGYPEIALDSRVADALAATVDPEKKD